jgi:signal transduction histidine kinase
VTSTTPETRQREVLRQAGVALHDRLVVLWEVTTDGRLGTVVTSVVDPPQQATELDRDTTLGRWGVPIVAGSRWVGTRVDTRWCIAPVRTQPPAPPPGGIERRSRERLTLELAGLCVGLLDAQPGPHQRLPPDQALWELSRHPSVIAHEVGNPLTVALGNVGLSVESVKRATGLDPTFRATLLEDLAHATGGIEQATEYLRAIQSPPPGISGRLHRFDAVAVIRSCVTLERPLARKAGIQLASTAAAESVFLYGDPNALYQIATNLIRNAVHASQASKRPVVVQVDLAGDAIRLTVRDEGSGIAPADLPRLFDPGFTTKPRGSGSGMGLTVVREITEKMFGGKVTVESAVGVGTEVAVHLPIPPQRQSTGDVRPRLD